MFIGTTLFLVEFGNHRVLKFNNAAAKPDGASADGVLGEPDFTTVWAGASDVTWLVNNAAKAVGFPVGVAATVSGELLVSQNLSRISIFTDAAAKADFSAAENVLGQPDLNILNKGTAKKHIYGRHARHSLQQRVESTLCLRF